LSSTNDLKQFPHTLLRVAERFPLLDYAPGVFWCGRCLNWPTDHFCCSWPSIGALLGCELPQGLRRIWLEPIVVARTGSEELALAQRLLTLRPPCNPVVAVVMHRIEPLADHDQAAENACSDPPADAAGKICVTGMAAAKHICAPRILKCHDLEQRALSSYHRI